MSSTFCNVSGSKKEHAFTCSFRVVLHHPAGTPAGAVARIIAVGLLDVEDELFFALFVFHLPDFGGQALAVEQFQLVVEFFLGVKGVQLGPVGGKQPDVGKCLIHGVLSPSPVRPAEPAAGKTAQWRWHRRGAQ